MTASWIGKWPRATRAVGTALVATAAGFLCAACQGAEPDRAEPSLEASTALSAADDPLASTAGAPERAIDHEPARPGGGVGEEGGAEGRLGGGSLGGHDEHDHEPSIDGDFDPRAEYELKKNHQLAAKAVAGPAPVHEVVQLELDWEAAAAAPASEDEFTAEDRDHLAASPIPALVVPGDMSEVTVTTGESWVVWSANRDGITLEIQGHGDAFVHPQLRAEFEAAGGSPEDIRVAKIHEIWTVHFARFGAYYALDVECGQAGDPRCASDEYPLSLLDELRVAALGTRAPRDLAAGGGGR